MMSKSKDQAEKKYINKFAKWLGFLTIVFVMLYAYVVVLFEPKEVILDIVYFALFLLLLIGIFFEFKKLTGRQKTIDFKIKEVLAVFSGVFLTYSLTHFFGLNSVISASLVGVIGFILIKKYEIPLYCGAFAGMVSVSMFSYLEVLALATTCSIIFTISKNIFDGFGGKLGTIAFLSSLVVHSVFGDEFITVQLNLNIYLLILTTVFGVLITFYIHYIFKVSSVFASGVPSLIFALFILIFFPSHFDYAIIFFSASFIGMSSKEKLPTLLTVLLSGLILGLIYELFIEFFNGLGGKLGLMAMISVIITSAISNIFAKKRTI